MLAVTTVEEVASLGCAVPASQVMSRPTFRMLFVSDPDGGASSSSASTIIPANAQRDVRVIFESVRGGGGYCQHVGFRVHFSVDAEPVSATAETHVIRREPIRRH